MLVMSLALRRPSPEPAAFLNIPRKDFNASQLSGNAEYHGQRPQHLVGQTAWHDCWECLSRFQVPGPMSTGVRIVAPAEPQLAEAASF